MRSEKTYDMTYKLLKNYFQAAEKIHRHITGYIVIAPASFEKEYSVESRTYEVSSANKAFIPNMGGYSIYGSSIDGSDSNVRLEQYLSTEYGGRDGWQIERCYIKESDFAQVKDLIRREQAAER